jgi:hypothetical protein
VDPTLDDNDEPPRNLATIGISTSIRSRPLPRYRAKVGQVGLANR